MKSRRGFTLIELMITLVVVAILVAVSYPAYQKQVMKTHRADAKQALMACAQMLERFNTQSGSYAAGADANVVAACTGTSKGGYYTLPATNVPTTAGASTFTAVATPLGSQASDPCGSLTYTEAGTKGVSGGSESPQNCW